MSTLRAGILGCGSIAHRHAQAALKLQDEVELAAFCSRDESKACAFAERYASGRAAVYTDQHQMFGEAELDLLIVCLPPFAHGDEVEMAAYHGVHLLMEKPIALRSEDAWRMVAAAESAGIKTQVGFMFRFGAAVDRLKDGLESGKAGAATLMTAGYYCNSLHADWWRDRARSGGQLVEQLIHLFDLMRYLLGEPVSVFSHQSNLQHAGVPGYTAEDTSATLVEFAGGPLGVVCGSNAAVPGKWIKEWQVVAGKVVSRFSDWNHATFTPTTAPDLPTETVASDQDVFVLQLSDLLHAIRTGGSTRTPLREGARSLDLVLAARRSSETGEPVSLQSPARAGAS